MMGGRAGEEAGGEMGRGSRQLLTSTRSSNSFSLLCVCVKGGEASNAKEGGGGVISDDL